MQRPLGSSGDERKGDRRGQHAGELLLGLLGSFDQSLQCLAVAAEIDAVFGLEGIGEPVDDPLIEIISPQLRVAVGRFHIEHTVGDAKQRHVKGATTQIEDQNTTDGAAIKAIGKRGSGGFVENPLH